MWKEAVCAPQCAPPSSALGLPTQTDGARWSKRPSCLGCFLGCSRSPAARLRGGASEDLLTAGTPLGRVSRAHGRCPTPHQRPRRRSTMLLAPERLCAAILRRSPPRRPPQAKASSATQRSPAPRLLPPPLRRDNRSLQAGERSRAPLDRRVAHWPSLGQKDLGFLWRARRAR